MKKTLLSILIVLVTLPVLAQMPDESNFLKEINNQHKSKILRIFNHEQNQESRHTEKWNLTSTRMPTSKTIVQVDSTIIIKDDGDLKKNYTYDANGNLLTEKWHIYAQGIWENQWLFSSTYDNHGNMLSDSTLIWENNAWLNLVYANYEYDISGSLLAFHSMQWVNGAWVDSTIETYSYNTEGNLISSISKRWTNGEWKNSIIYTYTYDDDGNLLSDSYQNWLNDEWVNREMKSYTYDSYNNQLSFMLQDWGELDWTNVYLITKTYDVTCNVITRKTTFWHNNEWLDVWLLTNTYDTNGLVVSQLNQYWENGELGTYGIHTNTYDADWNRLTNIYQPWGPNTNDLKTEYTFHPGKVEASAYEWSWVIGDWELRNDNLRFDIFMAGENVCVESGIYMELYYTDVIGIEEQNAGIENDIIHCYPNPVDDKINIEINPEWQAESCLIELFNQNGQRVKFLEILSNSKSAAASINVTDLPPGLYLLKFTSGKSTSTRKVIISNR